MTPPTSALPSALTAVLFGNALMRIAGATGGVLIGLYLAALVAAGRAFDAGLVGALTAVAFGAELVGALPMGVLADARTPRTMMTFGALLGAIAVQLFGLSSLVAVFFLARALEGLAVAATTPSVLAFLSEATATDAARRGKVMSFFEMSLLGGLAFGGVLASFLWKTIGHWGFSAAAGLYLAATGLFVYGAQGRGRPSNAWAGLRAALAAPMLRRLAPAWVCINAMVGVWLGSTLPFLLTLSDRRGQFLTGVFADNPDGVGWALFGYAVIFATGVTGWSFILHRLRRITALRMALGGLFAACLGFYLLNHAGGQPPLVRWLIGAGTALAIMVESGFTPTALALLAEAVGEQAGRGATMGVYSVLLGVGAVTGALLGGLGAKLAAMDGLIAVTALLAVGATLAVEWLARYESGFEKSP
ncbi:MFS transporter [Chloracidobacterium validum]|uniref:MFS transporter n=1 Tax=Chloracidobacterium validum TaxID=2821543 RepID=A0ABX8BB69_9BACT|nr:MFS transporter [Chloracidobacterium validum]QUW04178.1 MFS transporter [Chloracidobacterium validum]